MLKSVAYCNRYRSANLVSRRFQSSSKKNLNINTVNPVLPKIKSTKSTVNNESSSNTSTLSEDSNLTLRSKKLETKVKRGFSSLPKVSSTYNFNPKELLLDNFFSGYRPMTLPITPPKKQAIKPRFPPSALNSAGGAFVYFEIDDNMNFIDEFKDDTNIDHTVQDIERQTSTRFDHSHKSLRDEALKNEQLERELYETKLESVTEEDLTKDNNPSNIVESKRYRGRRKLQYKKKPIKK